MAIYKFFWPLPSEMYPDNINKKIYDVARTYPGHGRNKLDFGAPKGTPIYAMTSGTVTFCGIYNDGSASACEITISGYGGGQIDKLVIRYLHGDYIVTQGQEVIQGQQIGTVNDIGSPGAYHLHLDFKVNGELSKPLFYGVGVNDATITTIENNMKEWNKQAGTDSYKGYCWQVIGNPATMQIQSSYIPGSSGGLELTPTCKVPSEFANVVFSDRFMAGGANSPAIKALAYSSTREFGFGDQGKSYGKLFRAWILYEVYRFHDLPNFRSSTATIDTFARYWSGLTDKYWHCYSSYGKEPEQNSQELCEIMYNNIKYPDIYGVTTDYCIEAMSNCPFQNETEELGSPVIPAKYNPLVFRVVHKYNGLWYVMYRGQSAISLPANPAVFE